MDSTSGAPESAGIRKEYEAPELRIIGEAGEVVLGTPGGGFDGYCLLTNTLFEFEQDDEQIVDEQI